MVEKLRLGVNEMPGRNQCSHILSTLEWTCCQLTAETQSRRGHRAAANDERHVGRSGSGRTAGHVESEESGSLFAEMNLVCWLVSDHDNRRG